MTHGVAYILLYVDDIAVPGGNKLLIEYIKNHLRKRFKMKDKGPLKNFLGFEIFYDRENGILTSSQKNYIEKLQRKFNIVTANPLSLLIEPELQLWANKPVINHWVPYNQLIGSLMFLCNTRPDICYSVNYFSQFNNHVTAETWSHAKNIIAYLKYTKYIHEKIIFH